MSTLTGFPIEDARRILRIALEEDCGAGDITSRLTIPAGHVSRGQILAKDHGVVAGLPLLPLAFEALDAVHPESGASQVKVLALVEDGTRVAPGVVVAEFEGPTVAILEAERPLLNLLQRLSGTATTADIYQKAAGSTCKVLDTRKTTPGMRLLEKYAIRAGGGSNHRLGLWDAVLIKENHATSAGGVRPAALAAIEGAPAGTPIIVEVETLEQLDSLLDLSITRVLLDNFSPGMVREAAALRNAKNPAIALEASGGITLSNLAEYAQAGVDCVSVGALTHSVKALDLSLLLER